MNSANQNEATEFYKADRERHDLRPREGNWAEVLDSVTHLCDVPYMSISRLLQILRTDLGYVPKDISSQMFAEKFGVPRFRLGAARYRPVAVNGGYQLAPEPVRNEAVVANVMDLITDETQAVIELGCGYGRHLFAIRDSVEHLFPHLKYYGGDISVNGLATARKIASLDVGRDNITFFPFDFDQPDISAVAEKSNLVFYTAHAIEQVKFIGAALFEKILSAGDVITCFHAEPVGWQMNDSLMSAVSDGSFSVPSSPLKLFGAVDDWASADVPVRSGWNRNLVEQLSSLERSRKITVELIERHASGNHLYNPTTHILWRKSN